MIHTAKHRYFSGSQNPVSKIGVSIKRKWIDFEISLKFFVNVKSKAMICVPIKTIDLLSLHFLQLGFPILLLWVTSTMVAAVLTNSLTYGELLFSKTSYYLSNTILWGYNIPVTNKLPTRQNNKLSTNHSRCG